MIVRRIIVGVANRNTLFFGKVKKYFYIFSTVLKCSKSSRIDWNTKIDLNSLSSNSYVQLGGGTHIKGYAILAPRNGYIKIGNNCSINPYCFLYGYGGITIGNHVRIASGSKIIAFNHNFNNVDLPISKQGNSCKGIIIENNVWIGANVTILDGVTILEGCVIAAGSVLSKSTEFKGVYAGVPAKLIKK
jgi:acetyltransferase-like isoleucine patch superfamily enzyme